MSTPENNEKVTASEAGPGFYRTRKGRVIRILPASRVSGCWPPRPTSYVPVPYKLYAGPREPVPVYGWLPPDYLLRPCPPPRHVAAMIRQQAARLNAALGRVV